MFPRSLRWPVAVTRSATGSLTATLGGPAAITLPALTAWRMAKGSPEAEAKFDDAGWQTVDTRASASITQRPDGQPNLGMDSYGFHDGDVWYRGRFDGAADAKSIALFYGGGGAGMMQVWLDGKFVGQNELPVGLPRVLRKAVPSPVSPPGW